MTQRESNCYWKLGLVISLVIGGVFASENRILAQVIRDETLGAESSVVKPNVIIDGMLSNQIDGGASRGKNLFHSFQKFNVGEGQKVYFTNPPGINNILSRVTGGSSSEILGNLGVLGNANLFLINPNGIIFGPNASLNLKGSFLASTASSLNFADGTQFSATATQTSPLLTLSVPIGLQFGRTAAGIRVQGATLEVQPGKTLGLVGGNVTLEDGDLLAPIGRIELGSVASNNVVRLNVTVKGWSFGYEGVQNFHNIQLTQSSFNGSASEVATSGNGSGDIQVQGKQVMLANGSQIRSINEGAEPGGNLTVTASESVELIGDGSALSSQTTAAGDAGDITINTGRLLISDEAYVSTESSEQQKSSGQTTVATGRGGNVTVNASESVELINGFMFSVTQGSGNAGEIKIETGQLTVRDKAEVTVSSVGVGSGSAGNLEVAARSIQLDNQGKLIAETDSGQGGNIKLHDLEDLVLRHGSTITTNATGTATGGNITIDTGVLAALENSDISANAYEGPGGIIDIRAQGIFGLVQLDLEKLKTLLGTKDPNALNPASLPSSDITAISQTDPSLSGQVTINTPEVDPNRGLIELPENIVDPAALIAQNPCARGSESEFIITGRGGVPPSPNDTFSSQATQIGLVEPAPIESREAEEHKSREVEERTGLTPSLPQPIMPAKGWVFNNKGEVVLTAHNPTVIGPQRLYRNLGGCPAQ